MSDELRSAIHLALCTWCGEQGIDADAYDIPFGVSAIADAVEPFLAKTLGETDRIEAQAPDTVKK